MTTTRYDVRFAVDVPARITLQDVEDWLRFALNVNCSLSMRNPLARVDLEALPFSVRARQVRENEDIRTPEERKEDAMDDIGDDTYHERRDARDVEEMRAGLI